MTAAYVAPLLFVGSAPPEAVPSWSRGTMMVQTPFEAANLVSRGVLVVVPTSEVARQALLMLGATHKAAMYATGSYQHRYDEGMS